jgi:Cu-processing system permease protein
MSLAVYRALARGVVLESVRRKDLWVVAILGFLIVSAAGALGFFGIEGLEIFAKDLAVTVLGMFSTIVAVLTSSRMLPDEIRQRTLYPLLARPISRFDLLIGKLLGSILVSWIAFLMLAGLTAAALVSFGVGFELIMLQYLAAKMMGLSVVCAVGLALSAFMTPAAAATLGFILAFGSGMIGRALVMGYESAGPAAQWIFKLVNSVLPQVGLFDLGSRVANIGWAPVPLWVMGGLFAYMAVYVAVMLWMGWLRFRRQTV